MAKFKSGLVLGSALGALLVWFHTTTKGKDVKRSLEDHLRALLAAVKKEVVTSSEWQHMKKNNYVKIVEKVVDDYLVKNDIGRELRDLLVHALSLEWRQLKSDAKKAKFP